MSYLGGRARSWVYRRRLTDATCFGTYAEFKEELRQAFEPPKNEFRSRAEFLDLQQGAGRPTGSAVARVYNRHATLKTAAPSERDSHCKKQDDKPDLVILKVWSKREDSLRALVDSGASNNFVRQQSLPKLNFEDVDTPRSVLEVRLATGATVRTEKRVVLVRFS
ncbi:hypothetical protein PC117_g26957 [Phytophthora cactorum]|uniref:Retrotransposon gag domain-containing protein n=1 Tax=Phytophthora cactorum TaxID=29920 RepID=A0A8T1ADQ6_9STRA|nr:hypothetical protein PC117_g26957 [Phytophthora cactorum]